MKTYTCGQIQIVRDALTLAHDTSDGEDNRKIRGAIDLLDMPLDAFEEVYRLKDEVKRLTADAKRYEFLRNNFATKSEHSVDDFIALEPMTGDYFDAHIDILMAEFQGAGK